MTGPTITNIQNSESLEMIETEGNTQKDWLDISGWTLLSL